MAETIYLGNYNFPQKYLDFYFILFRIQKNFCQKFLIKNTLQFLNV